MKLNATRTICPQSEPVGTETADNNLPLAAPAPAAKATRRVVKGRQSNHGSWVLPPEVAQEAPASLWVAVALWAQRLGRPVTRACVADAFRISVRRAADVLTYIFVDHADVVRCERRIVRVASGHRVLELRVLDVEASALTMPRPVPPAPVKKPRPSPSRPDTSLAMARDLFLGRRPTVNAG